MITLHYYPSNASFSPHVLLRELGIPFELQLVDRAQGAHKSPEYLKLNPNGLIPVLVDGDLVLYETAAILLHLADSHPQAALAPAVAGSRERAHFYKWLLWLADTMQATMPLYFYSDRYVDAGNGAGAAQVKAHAQVRLGDCLRQIDDLLAGHGGPWFLGAGYSVLDPYAFMLCRWTRGFAGSAPAREYPHIGPWLQRMLARPAVQQAIAVEKLPQPYV
ncbi:MAG: glutathione S-transferase family protein [Rubrivivax sp.]|nr:glutathione S-transferase family protein [Rubrivivax sp.]